MDGIFPVDKIIEAVVNTEEERFLKNMLLVSDTEKKFWTELIKNIDRLQIMMTDQEWLDFLAGKLRESQTNLSAILHAFKYMDRFQESAKRQLIALAGALYPEEIVRYQNLWVPYVEDGGAYLKNLELLKR